MRPRTALILAAIFIAAMFVIAWVNSVLPPPPDFPAPDIAPVTSHYLPFTALHRRNETETRLFLEEAVPRYGYYKNQTSGVGIKKGDPCLIVNVTIRNDYTEEQQPPDYGGSYQYNLSKSDYCVYFEALLYDSNGEVEVKGVAVNQAKIWGSIVAVNFIKIDSGEARNFDVYISTPNRNITRYELYVYHIGLSIF